MLASASAGRPVDGVRVVATGVSGLPLLVVGLTTGKGCCPPLASTNGKRSCALRILSDVPGLDAISRTLFNSFRASSSLLSLLKYSMVRPVVMCLGLIPRRL